jgi:hypothetical protein
MSRHFVFQALRAIVSSDEGTRYELLLADEGQDTSLGPLREYAARGALACLGFTAADIDGWIDRAPVKVPGCQ